MFPAAPLDPFYIFSDNHETDGKAPQIRAKFFGREEAVFMI